MKKLFFVMWMLAIVSIVAASEADLQKLKANHEAMIKKMGDVQFLDGKHHFAFFKNVPASVYALKDQKCVYAEYNGRKLYRVIVANKNLSLSFNDKIVVNENIYTLNYSISFVVADRSGGCFVTIDKENSDILGERADWAKIFACILKYGQELYEVIKSCVQSQDLMECLKIIGPATDIYNCISESLLGELNKTSDRAITTQTIYFSWSWGYSTGFKAPPVYKEMPYPVIGFDSVNISQASNAWNIIVSGDTTGNNVARVVLAQVTYMCYPTFWSSSLSGSIRCVMQKP